MTTNQKTKPLRIRLHGEDRFRYVDVPELDSLPDAISHAQEQLGVDAIQLDVDNCDFGQGAYALVSIGDLGPEDTILYGVDDKVAVLQKRKENLEAQFPSAHFAIR